MITKTYKIFSLCDDFDYDMYDKLSQYTTCDTFIEYTANTKESLTFAGYDDDPISNRLVELGANDGEVVLIHIDY